MTTIYSRRRWIAPVAIAFAFLIPSTAEAEEFRDLFNGRDLEGWVIEGAKEYRAGGETRAIWTVKDGMIVADAGRNGFGFLRYDKQEFSDFAFRVEYRMAPLAETMFKGNSGLGIRTGRFDAKSSRTSRPSYRAYEIQLQDDAGQPPTPHSTGSLYRYLAPSANPVKPAPEWNTIEIECVGPRIRVTINGQKVVDADQNELPDLKSKPATAPAPKDKALKGYVCLQSHSGKVEFRKVQIREIK